MPAGDAFGDTTFGLSSLLIAVLFGVAFGNVLRGVPISDDGSYSGSFLDLLNGFSLLVGLLGLSIFTMHGAIYLCGKQVPSQPRLMRFAQIGWTVTVILFIATTAAAMWWAPSLLDSARSNPFAWIAFDLLAVATVGVPLALRRRLFTPAFFASSVMIASMMALAAIGLFPRLLPASNDPDRTLHHLQQFIKPFDAVYDVHHRTGRYAARHRLHRRHPSRIPRQDHDHSGQLLGFEDTVRRFTCADYIVWKAHPGSSG